MNRIFWISLVLLLLLIPGKVEGQRWRLLRYEAGIGTGTVHPFMDIGSYKPGLSSFQITDSRPNINTHIAYVLLEDLNVKLDLNYLMIGATDSDTPERDRGFTFLSNAFEHTVRLDFNILGGGRAFGMQGMYNRRGMINNFGSSRLYVFGGVGGIMSKTEIWTVDGPIPDTKEGYYNNLNYGVVIPAGIGYRLAIDAYWDFTFEASGRFSFADKIDGYMHPSSLHYDRFITTSFKAVRKIRNDRKGRPIFAKYGFR